MSKFSDYSRYFGEVPYISIGDVKKAFKEFKPTGKKTHIDRFNRRAGYLSWNNDRKID